MLKNNQIETEGIKFSTPAIELADLVVAAIEYRLLIAVITSAFVLMSVAFVFVVAPTYRADALIQVEEKSTGLSAMREIQPLLDDTTSVSAELEILTSRMILSKVMERLSLQVQSKPNYFPIVGEFLAKRFKGVGLQEPIFGSSAYPWGGEILKISSLSVPSEREGEWFKLLVLDGDKYALMDESGNIILEGDVGRRAEKGAFALFVSRMVARPGVSFSVRKQAYDESLASLRKALSVKERTKKSGIIEASYQGVDKAENEQVLDEVLVAYVRQNVERRSAEAENTLRFLDGQLPKVKAELDAAEATYNAYRQSRGSLDLSIETQNVLQALLEIDNQIVSIKQERDELRQSFTDQHPRIQSVDQRLERLKERRRQFEKSIANLPDTQQKILQMARDVEVNTTLYNNLLNTTQQLRVSKAGTVGDVRVIDKALSARDPVGLKPIVVVMLGLLVGLLISVLVVAVKKALTVVVDDPNVIEEKLGLPVYATIPLSEDEALLSKMIEKKKQSSTPALLALSNPNDDAVECLRSLRATMHFVMLDSSRKSLLITGPSPGLGKSFISKNFGVILAQCGLRVLIVDADLRRGHINKEFSLKREIGVTEYISTQIEFDDIVKATVVPNLYVVTTGQIPPNPSELLMHARFGGLLKKAEDLFDMIIVDAPPVLAVADSAIIGKYTGSTLLVARAGKHPIAELEQAVKRLAQGGVSVRGVVFNCYDVQKQKYKYGYSGYVYRYSYREK